MSNQIRKVKDWFNQHIDEPEILYETKRTYPIRNRVGKSVVAIAILFFIMWIAIVIIAPEETIPQTREYYETQEPFQTISTWLC